MAKSLEKEMEILTIREDSVSQAAKTSKLGFLGLGIMGSMLSLKLIKSGYKVTVWNRTPEKCARLVAAGAEERATPADVAKEADYIFCCVSGPPAVKDIFYRPGGLCQANLSRKGYIEMSTVDPETSELISRAVTNRGGRYLEAQIQNSKTYEDDGTIVILAAGDRDLHEECHPFFIAMKTQNSFFLSEVGSAAKTNLVIQQMKGIAIAGLAEAMVLANRSALSKEIVLEVLSSTLHACPLVMQQAKKMVEEELSTQMPLEHMQKDLKLTLGMANNIHQYLPVTAAANEEYTHAVRRGFDKHDVSAIYFDKKV